MSSSEDKLIFSGKFKFIWWIILIIFFWLYILIRFDSFLIGTPTYIDFIFSTSLIVLLLLPFFQEIDIFGFKLKREIESLRNDIKEQIFNLRTSIQNVTEVRAEVSPTFVTYSGSAPTDSQLQASEEERPQILDEALSEHGIERPIPLLFSGSNETTYLFEVRYEIEKEIKRIWKDVSAGERRMEPINFNRMHRELEKLGIISPLLYKIMRDIINICNKSIHGVEVTERQFEFVRNSAPKLIAVLRKIIPIVE